MWKFYRDVTLFALLFSAVTIPFGSLETASIVFGVLGTPVGLLSFNYFQKAEFYGYYNLGYTRYKLVAKTWLINLCVTPVLFLITLIISKLITLGTLTNS
ncbi:hypothetical protein [Leeuwenhoekiella marinoflava]|uniref:Uncharacterized protein n=2 Tax=Leeuwenhoekiella marinoflava TaxID=988 RepID=A0A4Q0PKL8_9FLAO|nr:hypothetical protein [Leeuwenhoekiella marinoflava]RXG28481.1 hypothetical protein DSL99_2483 [Leeuwenhoekiella marinoflava]SHF52818.1 hypothetical protein SAMN02745246_02772 [Leeuwenhoekiella marinoflava DSM 3653]